MRVAALASSPYSAAAQLEMAARLDQCIEVSALCMDLALAGQMHRQQQGVATRSVPAIAGEDSAQTSQQ